MAKKLTSNKAKEILHDKSVHGHPLTDKQRRFFGAIAGGAKPYEDGGWLDKYEQGGLILKKKTKDNYGTKPNVNDAKVSAGPNFVGEGYTAYNWKSPAWGGQFQNGGSLPGSVGFMYARTQNPAPANGKYTKKTLASAQNGKLLAYPNTIDPAFKDALVGDDATFNPNQFESLKKQNAEYKKALVLFKDKLNEVAVFNANLAYATRLFTENTTTKQEKLNILKRFDSVSTLQESKNLFNAINTELGSKTTVTESVVEKISNAPQPSASQEVLAEAKAYENPQFARMRDLMKKVK